MTFRAMVLAAAAMLAVIGSAFTPARAELPMTNTVNHDYRYSINVDRRARDFEVHLPPQYDGVRPLPVFYMMPGVSGDIAEFKAETQMSSVADQKGFIVVYLEALDKNFLVVQLRGWNLKHGALTDRARGYNDLRYIQAVMNSVNAGFRIDSHAQYVVGHSEGGLAAQYAAQKIPAIAGFASVKGTRLRTDSWPQQGTDAKAALIILGRQDSVLSLDGGFGKSADGSQFFMSLAVPEMQQSLPLWQKQVWYWTNRCYGNGRTIANQYYQVTDFTCRDAPVREFISNTGHHWDGAYASTVVADFLLTYRKP